METPDSLRSFLDRKESGSLRFAKYQGLGNDFIMVDNLDSLVPKITPEQAVKLCDRNFIGADGVIFVMPGSNGADYTMRNFNSDGSDPEVDEEFSDADYKFSETNAGKLLKIEPLELKFAFEPNKQISCSLYLSNVTPNLVAFKVLTSNVNNYFVGRHNTGIILPHTTCGITVTMEAQKDPPAEMKCTDIFTIQSVDFTQSATQDIKKLFNKEEGQYVEECELPVVYLSAPIPLLPLPREAYSFLTQNGNFNCSEWRAMELLNIDQQQLKFPFEANKKISCSLQMLNIAESYVAFKVKTTHPKKFCVRPIRGIVLPRSKCDIIVTRQAQKALSEMELKEKFLIQSAVVSSFTPEEDVDWEMFKDAGLVKEYKLRVVYAPPPPPPPPPPQALFAVAEESKECSSEVAFSGKNASLDVSQETSKSDVQGNLGHDSSAVAVAQGSEECSSEIAFLGKDSSDISQGSVRLYIQRNLGRVSSTFDRILHSLRFTSRNKSTDDYQRLM